MRAVCHDKPWDKAGPGLTDTGGTRQLLLLPPSGKAAVQVTQRGSFRCKRQSRKGRGAGSHTTWLQVRRRMYGSQSSLRTGEMSAGKQASFQQPEEQRRLFTLHQRLLRPESKQKARLLISLPTQGQASRTPLNPLISSLILLFTHDVSATCEL